MFHVEAKMVHYCLTPPNPFALQFSANPYPGESANAVSTDGPGTATMKGMPAAGSAVIDLKVDWLVNANCSPVYYTAPSTSQDQPGCHTRRTSAVL
jgi:hypothetical protein